MFAVVFEVEPKPDRWDDYLAVAGTLRPELLGIEGFLDNVRYRSRRRPGWVLSLSLWENEAGLARWRAHAGHRLAQDRGRSEIFQGYRLRVGRVIGAAAEAPIGRGLVSLIDPGLLPPGPPDSPVAEIARGLGLAETADGLEAWDVFEALLTPGAFLLALSWRDAAAAGAGIRAIPAGTGHRLVAAARDYGMFARAEAPGR